MIIIVSINLSISNIKRKILKIKIKIVIKQSKIKSIVIHPKIIFNEPVDYGKLINIKINQNLGNVEQYKSNFEDIEGYNYTENKQEYLNFNNTRHTKYLFYITFKLKYQDFFDYDYNQPLFLKEVPFLILNQLKNFGNKINMEFVHKIFYKKKYLIFLVNTFGLIIDKMDNLEENIYNLISPKYEYSNSEITYNNIAIYYFKYINKIGKIFNIVIINILENEKMNQLLNKEYTDNKNSINSPIIKLNYEINEYELFINQLKEIFQNNMQIQDLENYDLNFYLVDQTSIYNCKMRNIKIIKIDQTNFLLKIKTLFKNYNNIEYKRFIVSFEFKN